MKASDYILGCDVIGVDGVAVGAGPYVANDPNTFLGRAWSSPEGAHPGQCVSLVRAATGAPHSSEWSPGDSVRGNSNLQPGTAIATFEDGQYKNKTDGTSHAALYMSQDDGGLYVVDQWTGQPARARYVRFGGSGKPVNDGNAFSVVLGSGLGAVVGDISDTATDYDYGRKQVNELVQYFNALGRPKQFEAAVEAVYAAYEKAEAGWHGWGSNAPIEKWYASTDMKHVGADASRLMGEIKAAVNPTGAAPSGGSSDVYDPGKGGAGTPSWWDKFSIPWWLWAGGGLVVAAVLVPVVAPSIGSLFAARRMTGRLEAARR